VSLINLCEHKYCTLTLVVERNIYVAVFFCCRTILVDHTTKQHMCVNVNEPLMLRALSIARLICHGYIASDVRGIK